MKKNNTQIQNFSLGKLFRLKFLFIIGMMMAFSSAFAQPCSLTNLNITVYTASDGKCYADVSFDMDRNNGNKFIYVHLWNTEQYAKVNKDRWRKGSGPNKTDIDGQGNGPSGHPSLATIAIDNNNYNQPVFSSYGYRPDPSVTVKTGTAVTSTSAPVSGSGPHAYYRYTIYKVLLGNGTVSGGCSTANVCGIVWSTQANSTNSHIHCSYIGCNQTPNPFTLSGEANCSTKTYSLTVKNNTNSAKQAEFDIYVDNSGAAGGNPNGQFDPTTDTKFDSGYFSINPNGTLTINRPIPSQYLNFDLWAQVMFSDGSTQLVKLTTTGCGPLPVTLSTFNASRTKQNVILKWQTASEQSVKGFGIERLTSAGWEAIGFVTSKAINGNSSSAINYELSDVNAFKGISQYRLRVTDLDGRYKYSEVKTVKGEFQSSNLLVYPNPGIDGKVNVVFEEANVSRDITVVDMSGRTVRQLQSVTANKITIENLKPGMHIIRVVNLTNGTTSIEKIMIAE